MSKPAHTSQSTFAAKYSALSDTDKSRIVCLVLHGSLEKIDWKAAAEDYGSASAASMQTMYTNAMRKLRGEAKAGGRAKDGGEPGSGSKRKAQNSAAANKKRKTQADPTDDDDEGKVKKEPHDSDGDK